MLSKRLFFCRQFGPSDLLHRLGNCQAIFQLLELGRRRLGQVINFEHVERDEGVQSIEFLRFPTALRRA